MDSEKGLQVIYVAAQFADVPEAFIKLARIYPQLAKIIFPQEIGNHVTFWKGVDDEKFLDVAYEHNFGPLKYLPPKNSVPYQVITDDEYDKLVNTDTYVTRHHHELTDVDMNQIYKEAKENKQLAHELFAVNNDCDFVWEYELLNAFTWLAKNFTLVPNQVALLFILTCKKSTLAQVKVIYESYKDSLPKVWTQSFMQFGFEESMMEDRARTAMWLADTFDFSVWIESHTGHRLTNNLFWINNVAAVQWLFEKYNIPADVVFFYPRVDFDPTRNAYSEFYSAAKPSEILWFMQKYGRSELAEYLSSHYGIKAAAPRNLDHPKNYDLHWLTKPPPPTMRLSEARASPKY